MKTSRFTSVVAAIVSLSSIVFASTANATPVEYQFTGILGGEFPFGSSSQLTVDQYPVPQGTPLSGTFYYDASVPVSQSTTIAQGALSDIVGNLGGYQFSSSSGNVQISGNSLELDFSGSFGSATNNNLQGFTANGLNLVGFVIGSLNFNASNSNGALPVDLTQAASPIASLLFTNPNIPQSQYQFLDFNAALSPVPIPPAIYMLGSGILTLVGASRRRA